MPGNPHDRAALRFSAGLLDFAREAAGLAALPFGAPASGAESDTEVAAAPWQRALLAEMKLTGAGAFPTPRMARNAFAYMAMMIHRR